MFKYYVTLT